MKVYKMVVAITLSMLTLVASMQADYDERVYVSDEELAESNFGNWFLQVENEFYSIDQLYRDQGIHFFLIRGNELGEFPEEYIIRCPCKGCGRLQTSSLVIRNKNKCSSCGQNMFRCTSK